MTNDKHTPGPWVTEDRTSKGAGFSVIATDVHYSCSGVAHYAGEADARLIAAAPDLLEALEQIIWKLRRKEMVASCPERFEFAKIDINDAVIRLAREALAKATGNAD